MTINKIWNDGKSTGTDTDLKQTLDCAVSCIMFIIALLFWFEKPSQKSFSRFFKAVLSYFAVEKITAISVWNGS